MTVVVVGRKLRAVIELSGGHRCIHEVEGNIERLREREEPEARCRILTRPIAAAAVLDALPSACERDAVTTRSVWVWWHDRSFRREVPVCDECAREMDGDAELLEVR